MNPREIENRLAFKIWTAVPRVEKYIIGAAAVQIIETIRFILLATIHLRELIQICDDSFTRDQPPISVTGHWRILSYIMRPFVSNLLLSASSEHLFYAMLLDRKLMDGLRCIDNFTQKCLEREHRNDNSLRCDRILALFNWKNEIDRLDV